MRIIAASILLLTVSHVPASAEPEAAAPLRAEFSVSRHYTDNALDEPLAVSDWYSLMRGSLSGAFEHDLGTTTLVLDGELRRFDDFTIENDAALGLEAKTNVRLSESMEIEAGAFLRGIRKGDAFVIDDLAIGTTTDKLIAGGSLLVGLRLAPELVSTSAITAFRERAGETRFEDDLVVPFRLEPDRDRLSVSQGLTRSLDGGRAIGLRGMLERTTISEFFVEPVDLDLVQLRGEAGWQRENGAAFALAAGVDWLRGSFDLVDAIRPSIEATAIVPLADLELRGSLRTAFDSGDTDDLLVSWVRRGEIELFVPLAERLALKTGVFAERRDNLVLDYDETRHGAYGEIGWQAAGNVTLVLRVDYRRHDAQAIGFEKSIVDASVGLRTQL